MPKKPKLVILVNAFVSTKSIGGGGRFIMQVAPTLAKRAKTTIILPSVSLHHWKRKGLVKANYQILKSSLFDNHDNPITITIAYLYRTLQTIQILKNKNPTHLITSSQYFPDIIPAALLKKQNPQLRWIARLYHIIPPATEREGNFLINSIVYLTQRLILNTLKQADLIVTDNPDTIKKLKKTGFPNNKLVMLVSGVQYNKILRHKPKKRYQFDTAYIGRLDPHKGIFDLPIILKEVTQAFPKVKLAIAGYGPISTTKKLKNMFKDLNLSSNVKFLGFLPHEKNGKHPLYDLYKSIKLLLLPNQEGGWPLAVAEAMAAGVPVIAYNLPIFSSDHKYEVSAVKMKDTKAFANKVITLLGNGDRLASIKSEAQKKAKQFDNKIIAKQFCELTFRT